MDYTPRSRIRRFVHRHDAVLFEGGREGKRYCAASSLVDTLYEVDSIGSLHIPLNRMCF